MVFDGNHQDIRRCRLNTLDRDERMRIFWNEIEHLRRQFIRGEISLDLFFSRRLSALEFVSGRSNVIDSNGVLVEFFVVGDEAP